MKLLLYCTKAKPNIVRVLDGGFYISNAFKDNFKLNGKIVAECDFEVEWYDTSWYSERDFIEHKGLEKSCLTEEQLFDYIKDRNEFYAIHIKNLHIFDKPRELSEFIIKKCGWGFCGSCKWGKDYIRCSTLEKEVDKAPQNMMYVYDNEERKILISIRPEWLCKILNGEKTIEVRKKVLKEILE